MSFSVNLDWLWNLSLYQWVGSLIILSSSFLLKNVFSHWIVKKVHALLNKQQGDRWVQKAVFDALSPPMGLLLIAGGIWLNLHVLQLPLSFALFLTKILKSLVTFSVFWIFFGALQQLNTYAQKKKSLFGKKMTEELSGFILTLLKSIVMILGGVTLLESWGINVSTFLGGLGLLTAAVGFAAKDTIANLFGSMAVFMDQTFKKGDWIKADAIEGVVEHIGLRTTTLRRFDKSLLVVPNGKLSDVAVVNFSKMSQRRISWTIGVRYETTSTQLETLIKRYKDYLEKSPDVETDPKKVTTLVALDGFGDSAINIKIYFFTKTTVWTDHSSIKQTCALALRRIMEEEGISFAFPSHSIYVEKNAESDLIPNAIKAP